MQPVLLCVCVCVLFLYNTGRKKLEKEYFLRFRAFIKHTWREATAKEDGHTRNAEQKV